MNSNRKGTRALLWAALLVGLIAQPARADWERMLEYEGEEDAAVAVATDAAGNSYVLATCENEAADYDAVVFKVAPDGDPVGDPWGYNGGEDTSVIALGMALDGPGNRLYVLATYEVDLLQRGYITLGYDLRISGDTMLLTGGLRRV